ncbi:hypothetical protein [Microcystis phage Mae-JY02]
MTIPHYEADDLTIAINVSFDAAAEITDLTGGVPEARVRAAPGNTIAATSCTITGPTRIRVAFAANALPVGVYALQVRVTKAGLTMTLADRVIDVRPSLRREGMDLLIGGRWSDAGRWNDDEAWRE